MSASAIPSELPLLPLRTGVLFPGTSITLPVGREKSLKLLRAVGRGGLIAVVTQKDASLTDPGADNLHSLGTLSRVREIERVSEGELRVTLEGLERLQLVGLVGDQPYLRANVVAAPDANASASEGHVLGKALLECVREAVGDGSGTLGQLSLDEERPGQLADQVAAAIGLSTDKEMEVLSALDVPARLRRVMELFAEARAVSDVKRKIDSAVRKEMGKNQREAVLREQLRAIQRELGDDASKDGDALREKLDKATLPEEVRKVADRELARLASVPQQSPEHNVIRTYLEWIADLPWETRADASIEVEAVARKLDADHDGLDDVKKRILEHMAVMQVSGNPRGTILCLVGPPGVGKTSLGKSVADATGRPFVRISLGGVRDEAEIRGHRRTYVGALPGRLIHALRKAKVKNPVVLLDEVDKLFSGWAGSPEAALLEVLDPEQNKTFTDHYLELPFDLSEVLFICTANTLETLSAPLRDRLEIVELSGYTAHEKVRIAERHLWPRLTKEHGLDQTRVRISSGTLEAIVRDYTREAGVRKLTQELTRICRALALESLKHDQKADAIEVDEASLGKYLGKVKFFGEVAERTMVPGVATGLAWTPVGGDILFVESSRMPGKGRLEITGQVGDVMKESARAALSYVRAHATELGVDPLFLESQDIHVHVPAGGIPKDGPSAGVTMFTALASLLSGRKVRGDTAMTGEVTLRGRVLPVGGIKAKVMAAHRAGLTRVLLPHKNQRDADEIPESIRSNMEFVWVDDMAQVLAAALQEATHRDESGEVDSSLGGPLAGASVILPRDGAPGVHDAT
jgi:ATP-dependent Lon protease